MKTYFYHSDHLGSIGFVTDADAKPVQHLQYLPFGELFVSQMASSFDSRYKFTGKERDEEPGYDYCGARYYDSDGSFWLSVDPMSDGRPNVSPYAYCQNNPIGRIDPNGALDGWVEDPDNPNAGVHWDPKINSESEATAAGKIYRGQTVLANDANGNFRFGDENGQWQKSIPLNEVTATASSNNSTIKLPNPELSSTVSSTPWMDYALKEVGVKESDPGSNPRIETYLKSAGLNNATDATPWCGSFVNWSLSKAGIKGAGARGNNYLNWGIHLDKPKYGAVAVFKTGHVGFYMNTNKDGTLKILHGNWSNRVKISSGSYDPIYPKQIREYRFPNN